MSTSMQFIGQFLTTLNDDSSNAALKWLILDEHSGLGLDAGGPSHHHYIYYSSLQPEDN